MKYLKRFNEEFEQELIDSVLDKISKDGIDSLDEIDKHILDNPEGSFKGEVDVTEFPLYAKKLIDYIINNQFEEFKSICDDLDLNLLVKEKVTSKLTPLKVILLRVAFENFNEEIINYLSSKVKIENSEKESIFKYIKYSSKIDDGTKEKAKQILSSLS
jgi:hypothetical protein